MVRTDQPQAPQEYDNDQKDVDAPLYVDNTMNYNIEQQVSYNVSDPIYTNTNFVQDQYLAQPNPVMYPPPQQVNPGFPMQYPPAQSTEPVQFPPPPSKEEQQPYQPQTSYGPPIQSQNRSGIPMAHQFPIGTQPWKTNLFDCMADPENAILTAVVPCLTFGQIVEVMDNGNTTCAVGALKYLFGLSCLFSCAYRTKLRQRYGLMETPASDLVTHCMFEWCALCQEFRELKLRGLDPSIGWLGNVARQQQQQQQMGLIPPTNQTMNYRNGNVTVR